MRVAVIGVGYFGNLHASKFAAIDDAELVAVCDTDGERCKLVADRYETKAVSDFRDILGEVDAVSIVVPTTRHFSVAKACLSAGVDVLLEKPMCETLEQADELIALAKANDRVLQIGHLERYSPTLDALRDRTRRPGYIQVERIARFIGRGTDTTVILDMMIHDLDHLIRLVDSPIERIDAVGVPVLTSSEDIANARIQFENGCVASVTASRISGKTSRTIRVFQPDAYLVADLNERRLVTIEQTENGSGPLSTSAQERSFEEADLLMEQARLFLRHVRERSEPAASATAIRPALAAALEITEQLRAWRRKFG